MNSTAHLQRQPDPDATSNEVQSRVIAPTPSLPAESEKAPARPRMDSIGTPEVRAPQWHHERRTTARGSPHPELQSIEHRAIERLKSGGTQGTGAAIFSASEV
eukprot:3288029-Pyramimonas_sp.AAC.1